ncbi:porin family protein [Aestuariicella hydrocarbonica]|uniref:Porin family protein n=1 Tax=Pseudomaricurvus hydrocarbonicus TaxID=1470433 RepID=A0A9E5MKE4_9GAMM|nr:porin family protein [Aestuariicella hydrocarbonica]NHO66399.1 porin family protein [Aestuariicella hydrocarbonica]
MKRLTSLLSASVLMFTAGMAWAGADSGFYIGGSVGNAEVDYSDRVPNFGKVEFNEDDTAYKAFGGFNFGIIPLIDLAIEGSYVDFGSQKGDINNALRADVDITGWTATGLVGLKFGPFGLFAKGGVINWDTDVDLDFGGSDSDSGTDPVYGIGARFQIGSFAIRAEYEYFDMDKFETDFYSVGASYTF